MASPVHTAEVRCESAAWRVACSRPRTVRAAVTVSRKEKVVSPPGTRTPEPMIRVLCFKLMELGALVLCEVRIYRSALAARASNRYRGPVASQGCGSSRWHTLIGSALIPPSRAAGPLRRPARAPASPKAPTVPAGTRPPGTIGLDGPRVGRPWGSSPLRCRIATRMYLRRCTQALILAPEPGPPPPLAAPLPGSPVPPNLLLFWFGVWVLRRGNGPSSSPGPRPLRRTSFPPPVLPRPGSRHRTSDEPGSGSSPSAPRPSSCRPSLPPSGLPWPFKLVSLLA